MLCPKCNSDVYIVKDKAWLHTQYYKIKKDGKTYSKKSFKSYLDTGGNGTFPFSLCCSKCDWDKKYDDKWTKEEEKLIFWAMDNL